MIALLLAGWLHWTAPTHQGRCAPNADLAHDRQTQHVLSLNDTIPPFYRRSCEADSACWDSVRTFNIPDTVAKILAMPGQRCSLFVAPGQYVVVALNSKGFSCWSTIRIIQ